MAGGSSTSSSKQSPPTTVNGNNGKTSSKISDLKNNAHKHTSQSTMEPVVVSTKESEYEPIGVNKSRKMMTKMYSA